MTTGRAPRTRSVIARSPEPKSPAGPRNDVRERGLARGHCGSGPRHASTPRCPSGQATPLLRAALRSRFDTIPSAARDYRSTLIAFPQRLYHRLQDRRGAQVVGRDVDIAVAAGVGQASLLLLVILERPVESFPLGASGEGGVEEDENVRRRETVPHVGDVGVLLCDLPGGCAALAQPEDQRRLARAARPDDADAAGGPAGIKTGCRIGIAHEVRRSRSQKGMRTVRRRVRSPCRSRMAATSIEKSSPGRLSSRARASPSRPSAQRADRGPPPRPTPGSVEGGRWGSRTAHRRAPVHP